MDGHAPLIEVVDAHLQPHQQGRVQILVTELSQLFHAGEIPVGFHVVGQIDELFQQRHVRLAGGVVVDGPVDLVRLAEHMAGQSGPRFGVEQLHAHPLQIIQNDTIFLTNLQLLFQTVIFCTIM